MSCGSSRVSTVVSCEILLRSVPEMEFPRDWSQVVGQFFDVCTCACDAILR